MIAQTTPELTKKVKQVMAHHVGEENAISSQQLFKRVYGEKFEDVDIYEARYLWEVILRITSNLRVSNEMFIINKYEKSFVLKSDHERLDYHKVQDSRIEAIRNLKRNADIWTKERRWRDVEVKKVVVKKKK